MSGYSGGNADPYARSKPYPGGSAPYPDGSAPYPGGSQPYPAQGYPNNSYHAGNQFDIAEPVPNAPSYSNSQERTRRVSPETWNRSSFSDKNIRIAFIRKVYMILTTQLLFTVALICVFIFVNPVKEFMREKAGFYFYIAAYVIFLVTYIVLVCCSSVRRKYPANYITLIVFTAALSLMAATISSYHKTGIVLIMMGVTAGVCISVSIFACQTKIDFTRSYCTLIAFALGITVFFFGIAIGISAAYQDPDTFKILNIVYGGLGALVFALFLAIETQLIIGNKRHSISEEEYIYGATQLYLDIVFIFMCLLGAGGGGD